MNISSASQYLAYRNIASFKSSNIHKSNETTPQKTVNNSDDKKQGRKQKLWKYVSFGILALTIIANIIVEHRIRAEKRSIEAEKELADKFIKDLQEQSKKLDEEIKKQKELINKLKQNSNNCDSKDIPEIDVDPFSKK
jgi:hypothetical protein|nr:MAG TPA: voltage-gated sodium channel protein [Caudoviricetes sp.]